VIVPPGGEEKISQLLLQLTPEMKEYCIDELSVKPRRSSVPPSMKTATSGSSPEHDNVNDIDAKARKRSS
jgi:hypothetical protein